ncbi:hypothetical protein [Streptomyces sp. NPDC055036]
MTKPTTNAPKKPTSDPAEAAELSRKVAERNELSRNNRRGL